MKLSKIYLFKKSKSDEIISFTFPFIDAHLKIPRGKRQHQIVFSHTKFVFNPPKSAKKDQNMTIIP